MSKHASQLVIICLVGACSSQSSTSSSASTERAAAGGAATQSASAAGGGGATARNQTGQAAGRDAAGGTSASSEGQAGTTSESNAGAASEGQAGAASEGQAGAASEGQAGAASEGQAGAASDGHAGSGTAGQAGARSGASAAEGCSGDLLNLLRGYAPSDEDLAKDYETYITEELGTLTCALAGSGNARTLTQTIFVPPNATYDGKGETLTADAAAMRCDTTKGEQAESQRPFFLLAPGAQLKNVTITYPGCEGVHMMGDNVLDHIVWQDAGEDAASVRSYFPGGKITISNSEGHKAADKMFQFNAPCDVRIERFQGSDMGKLVRQNGGSEFELRIDLNQVTVTDVVSAVVQSDSPLCYVRYHELSYAFQGSGDKSDRVFRDLPPANVTEY